MKNAKFITKRERYIFIKEQLKEPIPKQYEKFIRTHGCITGSKVFGGFVPGESDVDVILLNNDAPNFFDELIDHCYVYLPAEYNYSKLRSIYVLTNSSKYIHNLLFFWEEETYKKWYDATILLREIKKQCPSMRPFLINKRNRIDIFETLKGVI